MRLNDVSPDSESDREQAWVFELAEGAADRSAFLKTLATELQSRFGVGLVGVESCQWSAPMMLVADERLAQSVDRDAFRGLLRTATTLPSACDVPVGSLPPVGDSEASTKAMTRGLRIEVTTAPTRTAVLLVYATRAVPAPPHQIGELKRLDSYAKSARDALGLHFVDPTSPPGLLPADSAGLAGAPSLAAVESSRQALRLFHRDLDFFATNYRIANETRRLLDVDRVTMLVPQGNRYRVAAISGVATIDKRSNSVRAAQRLATAAAVMDRPLELPGDDALPPQIQQPLDEYLDETGVASALLLPLHSPDEEQEREGIEASQIDPFHGHGEIVAVMLLESFSTRSTRELTPAINAIASEATLSLRNAAEHRSVFGLPVWKAVGRFLQADRLSMVAVGMLALAVLISAGLWISVDHHVVATGTIEPQSRRQVFAAVDGVVKTVHVDDGEAVKAGQPLFELENVELEARAEALSGEIQTASQRLASLRATRLNQPSDAAQTSRLTLEERQLESELANLRGQQNIIRSQLAELSIASPISGTVVGWRLRQRLKDRPVSRGNLLVSIVDQAGHWSVQLEVPDRESGPVLEAFRRGEEPAVVFAVATLPNASFAATLKEVGTVARVNEFGQHVIDACGTVALLQDDGSQRQDAAPSSGARSFDPDEIRIGADVTAKVYCGRRSLLASWFSDAIDFVHRNVLFRFRS